MILNFDYDALTTVEKLITDLMETFDIPYEKVSPYQVKISKEVNKEKLKNFERLLYQFHIDVNKNTNYHLMCRIREHIEIYLNSEISENFSEYLAAEMAYSYSYLSRIFKEVTHISIENYLIFKKLELVKILALDEGMTLTEISYKLGYSSVAHLSRQFKAKTGINFQDFQKIITQRNLLSDQKLFNEE